VSIEGALRAARPSGKMRFRELIDGPELGSDGRGGDANIPAWSRRQHQLMRSPEERGGEVAGVFTMRWRVEFATNLANRRTNRSPQTEGFVGSPSRVSKICDSGLIDAELRDIAAGQERHQCPQVELQRPRCSRRGINCGVDLRSYTDPESKSPSHHTEFDRLRLVDGGRDVTCLFKTFRHHICEVGDSR